MPRTRNHIFPVPREAHPVPRRPINEILESMERCDGDAAGAWGGVGDREDADGAVGRVDNNGAKRR